MNKGRVTIRKEATIVKIDGHDSIGDEGDMGWYMPPWDDPAADIWKEIVIELPEEYGEYVQEYIYNRGKRWRSSGE